MTFPPTDWVWTERGSCTDAASPEVLLGLDCEMCVCEGQVRELVRVAVVDRHSKVLLNSLVKPSRPVVDYKSLITGVSAEDLAPVTFTQADAQKEVKKLLSPGSILVGHGLHHDLRALKIDHQRVIDTSLIFQYKGLSTAVPALSDLCQTLLQRGIRETGVTHDSVEDASAPMHLVLHELQHGPTPPLPPPSQQVDASELAKLFVHKIPRGTSPATLSSLFPPDCAPHVQMVTWKTSDIGVTFAVFKNAEHANRAFKALSGTPSKDSLGRAQKAVAVGSAGGRVVVRKMGCHNGQLFGVDARKGAAHVAQQKEPRTKKRSKRKLGEADGEELVEWGAQATSRGRGSDLGSADPATRADGAHEGQLSGGSGGEGVPIVAWQKGGAADGSEKTESQQQKPKGRKKAKRGVLAGREQEVAPPLVCEGESIHIHKHGEKPMKEREKKQPRGLSEAQGEGDGEAKRRPWMNGSNEEREPVVRSGGGGPGGRREESPWQQKIRGREKGGGRVHSEDAKPDAGQAERGATKLQSEVEELRRQLQERDSEVLALQRLVTQLAKNQTPR